MIIFVTGISGFIGQTIAAKAVAKDIAVIGSTRGEGKGGEGAKGEITIVGGLDLMNDSAETWAAAFKKYGVQVVLHVASPYILEVTDPQKQLVEPAVQGTTKILEAAASCESVRRVVLTSSFAAITDSPTPGHVYTEDDWNTTSSLTRNPYYYSKVQAERAAVEFVEKRDDLSFDLVRICPYMVIGRSERWTANESNRILSAVLNGEYPALFAFEWGIVSVEDVADAHVNACEESVPADRYLLIGGSMTMKDIVTELRDELPDYSRRLPTTDLTGGFGNAVMKLGSFTRPKYTGQWIRHNIGRGVKYDVSRSAAVLPNGYRDVKQVVREAAQFCVESGDVKPLPSR
jgi:dihydroflavonol-4-reductase